MHNFLLLIHGRSWWWRSLVLLRFLVRPLMLFLDLVIVVAAVTLMFTQAAYVYQCISWN